MCGLLCLPIVLPECILPVFLPECILPVFLPECILPVFLPECILPVFVQSGRLVGWQDEVHVYVVGVWTLLLFVLGSTPYRGLHSILPR